MEEGQFDLAAALLRTDTGDSQALAEVLAGKLSDALPEQTTVQRKATRLFAREKRVERIEVRLGDDSFLLSLAGFALQASRARTVGGVVIKREQLALDRWLDALGKALAAEAKRSESARVALERLLG